MAANDPTIEEMRVFLTEQYAPEIEQIDIEGAIYWFACAYHGGQTSNLYSALSTSEYRPGPIESGPEEDSLMQEAFTALEIEFAPTARLRKFRVVLVVTFDPKVMNNTPDKWKWAELLDLAVSDDVKLESCSELPTEGSKS